MKMRHEKERDVVRTLARQSLSQDDALRLKESLDDAIQWPFILRSAIDQGIAPLLFHHFNNLALMETLPAYVRQVFSRLYGETMLLNRHITAVLSELEKACEGSEIRVIVFKGAALLSTVYRDIALRPMEDIDLMVRPKQKDTVQAILSKRGFVRDPLYPMTFRRGVITVDVHDDFLSTHRIRSRRKIMNVHMDDVWARSIPLNENLRHIFRLSQYDNLLALSFHILKHRFSRLIWFADIRESVNAGDTIFGWTGFLDYVDDVGAHKIVLYALLLAKHLVTMDVPDYVLQRLGKDALSTLEHTILRLRLADADPRTVIDLLWIFQIPGGVRRLQFIFENIFPRQEVMNQIFPGSSLPVHTFLRRAIITGSRVFIDGASAFKFVAKGGLPPL